MFVGAPLGTERALDKALSTRCSDLRIAIGRLKVLPSHDALILLRSSFSVPLAGHSSLTDFDNLLREGISSINSLLSDIQWLQASLPIRDGAWVSVVQPRWHFPPFWLPPRARRISSTVCLSSCWPTPRGVHWCLFKLVCNVLAAIPC